MTLGRVQKLNLLLIGLWNCNFHCRSHLLLVVLNRVLPFLAKITNSTINWVDALVPGLVLCGFLAGC